MDYRIFFPHLGLEFDYIPKTFSIFGFSVAMYGVVIACGIFLGSLLVFTLAVLNRADQKMTEDDAMDAAIITIICAIIGARAYYVIFSWDYYSANPLQILNLRGGGLAIYGGVIGGVAAGLITCIRKKLPVRLLMDCAMPGLLVGQILGRWGNFFNREAFGTYCDGKLAMQVPLSAIRSMSDVTDEMLAHAVEIDGSTFISVTPTFLYESLWNLGALIILLCLFKHRKYDGQIFILYFLLYGIGRFWVEGMRTDQLIIGHTGIPVSQLLAAIMAVAAAIALIVIAILRKRKAN